MRCPDCNKFVAFDTDTDPEVNSQDVDADGVVEVEVRIVNTCAECGTELKEATLNVTIDLAQEIAVHYEDNPKCKEAASLSVDVSVTRTDRRQTTDRHGKKITNPRYQKQFYGADVEATVTCDTCKEEFTRNEGDEVQASGMEELV